MKKRISRNNLTNTEQKRSKLFKESIKFGRIFPCICCHRLLFKNGVTDFVAENFSEEILGKAIGSFNVKTDLHICFTCKRYLFKKKFLQ